MACENPPPSSPPLLNVTQLNSRPLPQDSAASSDLITFQLKMSDMIDEENDRLLNMDSNFY